MVVLYGIKNCDSVKKAKNWLESFGVQHEFHDFREKGVDHAKVKTWLNCLGWETVINRRSIAWKSLTPEMRMKMDSDRALEVILKYPTLIKRPVIETKKILIVGFKASEYRKCFLELDEDKDHD